MNDAGVFNDVVYIPHGVMIDGRDVRDVTLDSLRRQVGVVLVPRADHGLPQQSPDAAPDGWQLPLPVVPIKVTTACSAATSLISLGAAAQVSPVSAATRP